MISFNKVSDIRFSLKKRSEIKKWIKAMIEEEGFTIGDINYAFCSNDYIFMVNVQYLKHHYFTDVITFDNSEETTKGRKICGDIIISIESVKENAKNYKSSLNEELSRVMAHGVLHLVGYDDHDDSDQQIMRAKEDYYIQKSPLLQSDDKKN